MGHHILSLSFSLSSSLPFPISLPSALISPPHSRSFSFLLLLGSRLPGSHPRINNPASARSASCPFPHDAFPTMPFPRNRVVK